MSDISPDKPTVRNQFSTALFQTGWAVVLMPIFAFILSVVSAFFIDLLWLKYSLGGFAVALFLVSVYIFLVVYVYWRKNNPTRIFREFFRELVYDDGTYTLIPNETELESIEINIPMPIGISVVEGSRQSQDIIATLVIDAVLDKYADFHILVENNGDILIDNIKYSFRTKEMVKLENYSYMPRSLAAGHKLSLPGVPHMLIPGRQANLFVDIFYTTTFEGRRDFVQRMRFFLRPSDYRPQSIHPESCDEKEISVDTTYQNLEAVATAFRQPSGHIGFTLPEIAKSGHPNLIEFEYEDRMFIFNPTARSVLFKMRVSENHEISLDLPLLESNSGNHVIMFGWDDKGGTLSVDGIVKKEG